MRCFLSPLPVLSCKVFPRARMWGGVRTAHGDTERRNSPIENTSWIKAPREAIPGRLEGEGEGDCYGESPFYGSD